MASKQSGAAVKEPAAAAVMVKPEKKYCDMCWLRGNKQGLGSIQTCRRCGVSVHKECYGNPKSTAPAEDFVCLACRAVGTTVKVRKRDGKTGRRQQFKIKERPTECCLCSVDDGDDWPHAMHPVYDHYGDTGRQLLLQPSRGKPYHRPAWAHTICCVVINAHPNTAGCVYGCTSNGDYDGEGNDANSDTSSVNSDLQSDDSEEDDEAITHYVYCQRKKGGRHNQWTKAIRQQQKEIKCVICGEEDSPRGILRIPLQCVANEDVEYADFVGAHGDLGLDTCYAAMHVGCAFWGRDDAGKLPACRRVYYFPGQEKEDSGDGDGGPVEANVVNSIYCEKHAEDLAKAGRSGATLLRYPKHLPVADLPRNLPPASSAAESHGGPSVARMAQERGRAKFRSSPTKPRAAADRGDVRSRLGLRDPTVYRRLSAAKRPASSAAACGAQVRAAKRKKK